MFSLFYFLSILNRQLFHFMRVRVPSKINFSIECTIAHLTRKRFETGVFPAVCDEVWRLAKSLATLQTLVRFFSCVNIRVLFHVRFLMKSLSTVVTWEGPCIRMNKHVCWKRGRAFERFVALFALKRSLVGVNVLMLFQADYVAECFTTDVACKRAPSRVRASYVHFQTVWCTKHLFTVQTIKRLTIVCLFRFLLFVRIRLRCCARGGF